MKHKRLENMVKGWFVGDFEPSAYKTKECEVAVKHYRSGDSESEHYHKIATEITLILSGQVRMMGRIWNDHDIIVISPGEVTAFEALTDATTVVVKLPSVLDDKYTLNKA